MFTQRVQGLKVYGDLYIADTELNEAYSNEELRDMIFPGVIRGNIFI